MAWEDWNDAETAATWNEILDVLEDEARRFATSREEELKFFVTAGRWDEPDVEVRWTDGDLQRNVHLMANGKTWPLEVEYSAGVWLDFDESSGRKRIWDSKVVSTRRVENVEELRRHIGADLEGAFRVASVLSLSEKLGVSSFGAGAD